MGTRIVDLLVRVILAIGIAWLAAFLVGVGIEAGFGAGFFWSTPYWIVFAAFGAAALWLTRDPAPPHRRLRGMDPEDVARVRAAHRPSPAARRKALLKGLFVTFAFCVLGVSGFTAITGAAPFGLDPGLAALLFIFLGVTLAFLVAREKRTRMRSLGPRTSAHVRTMQRKEVTSPAVHNKAEI